jgi:hypothetical protein
VCNSIKNAVGRPRPFETLPGVFLHIGKGSSPSMPSSHAANWFSLAIVLLVYYRRTIWFMLPMALLVSFSRVYNGVHYPSDVLAGAVLGAGYGAAVIWLFDDLWQYIGPRWFPLWKSTLPSLVRPVVVSDLPKDDLEQTTRDAQWLRLGYFLIGILLLVRLGYLASGKIELSEDEAYQWLWSKHLALSYYSKPPLIAYTQFLGTHLWGDNAFGVRFFSPVITAILSILILRFMAKETSGRTSFILLLALCACPLLALGSVVMTVDPLSVLFWVAALLAGWRAAGYNGTTRQWLWVGLWLGLGFLSKYTNLYQLICWAVFFFLWPPARVQLVKPGPWLALLVLVICSLPVLIWNSQHGWITVAHVASDGKLGQSSDRNFVLDFLLTESLVLNPVLFIGAVWASFGFWTRGRSKPLQLFLFSMSAPLILMYFALSFHARVLPNWIAPAVVPLFCLAAIYWPAHWERRGILLTRILAIGIGGGIFIVVLAHNTQLINKIVHRSLPARKDVMRRARGWKETAEIAGLARAAVEKEGKPAFIICEHYGFTSEISFYLPEAKNRVNTDPLVYYLATGKPDNQFYFWPSYLDKKGQNAIFVREMELPKLKPDWLKLWWNKDPNIYLTDSSPPPPLPRALVQQFTSFHDLGVKEVKVGGDAVRRMQIVECENLR